MDHHRPQIPEIRVCPLDRRDRGQVLRRSCVPVTVRDRLHATAVRMQQRFAQCAVGHRAIAAVTVLRPLIGRAHPCGTSLRGSIQKHLAAAQLKVAVIPPHRSGKDITGRIQRIHARIGDHIQLQHIACQQLPVQRKQAFRQHALLHSRHTMGGVHLLRAAAGVQQAGQIGGRHLLLVVQESVFLHVAGQHATFFADRAARRSESIRRYAEQLKRTRVKHTHMSGLMHDHNGMRRGNAVEQGARRMALLSERGLVIALADHPCPLRHTVIRNKARERLRDAGKVGFFSERRLQQRIRRAGKVAVRVDKPRQQRPALQVDLRCVSRPRPQCLQSTHSRDHAVFHQQRPGRGICFHRTDWAAVIQRFHAHPFLLLTGFQYITCRAK